MQTTLIILQTTADYYADYADYRPVREVVEADVRVVAARGLAERLLRPLDVHRRA